MPGLVRLAAGGCGGGGWLVAAVGLGWGGGGVCVGPVSRTGGKGTAWAAGMPRQWLWAEDHEHMVRNACMFVASATAAVQEWDP
jgi:hypothetical protein